MRAGDAIRLWLLVPFALTLFAPATHAACTGNITDLRVTDPPTQSYAHVEADYALTEASGGITISRRDEVTGEETFGFPANANVSGSGTFSSDIGFECIIPNRAYSYRAVLTTGCNPQITAERTLSRTYDPRPSADGAIVSMADDKLQMTVSVHYAFPYVREDAGPGRRRIQYQIDGTFWGEILLQPGEPREGTKTRLVSLSCLGTGKHGLTFSATFNPQSNSIVCWSSPEDEPELFDIKQAQITSLDIQPVGDGRHFLATAGYRFESTPADSRRVILSFNNMQDVQGAACCSPAGTASKQFELPNCLAPGTYTLTAQAVACSKPDDPRFIDVRTMSLSIPVEKGDVSLERLLDPSTSLIKLKVGHTLPPGITSATRTVRALEIVGDNGNPIPDVVIQTRRDRSSSWQLSHFVMARPGLRRPGSARRVAASSRRPGPATRFRSRMGTRATPTTIRCHRCWMASLWRAITIPTIASSARSGAAGSRCSIPVCSSSPIRPATRSR